MKYVLCSLAMLMVIGNANAQITTAKNGLNIPDGSTVQLGGALLHIGFFMRNGDLQKVLASGYLCMGLIKGSTYSNMDAGFSDYYFVYFRASLMNNLVIDKKDIGYLRSK